MVLGLAITAILAIIFGIAVHYAVSVVIIALYLCGLVYVVLKFSRLNDILLKKIHFNLCLILRNENERLYSKHNMKARVGHLSQWIEFQAIN